MEKDKIESLFENLKSEFDIEEPSVGHELRFISKLEGKQAKVVRVNPEKSSFWKPLLSIAASLVLLLAISTVVLKKSQVKDLASISPELSQTQDYFTSAINNELASLNNERSPETETIIKDALEQINLLEIEYENLKIDLTESGDDKRVIYAMISNFQNRIDLLQNVLKQIEEVKQLNNNNNENNFTI